MNPRSRLVFVGASVVALLASAILASCQSWNHDVTVHGVAFSKAHTTEDGFVIGRIANDQTIAGRPCRKGWVHLHSNGVPAAFTSSGPIALRDYVIPPGTWVVQSREGTITMCAFPGDIEIQGHMCRGGSGGSEGVEVTFYPSGALKQFFPTGDVVVDGVPCSGYLFRSGITLHENGRLGSATVSRDFSIEGRRLNKGAHIRLTPDGRLATDLASGL